MQHKSVLLKEVVRFLEPKQGKRYIDATFGMGGHASELMNAGAEVLGIDADTSVIANGAYRGQSNSTQNDKLVLEHGNFSAIKQIAEKNSFTEVDGILLDLGFGSHQLDDAARGFSFQKEGPLDMRFDHSLDLTAGRIVNEYYEKDLISIFKRFGEEQHYAKKIARAIIEFRKSKALETTTELFELIKKTLPAKLRYRAQDKARKIFQALRIETNHELESLQKGLEQSIEVLKPGGKLAVISFHSLEDRIVKRFMTEKSKDCICPPEFPECRCETIPELKILTKKPIVSSEEEIKLNSRAKSAKLRIAEKL